MTFIPPLQAVISTNNSTTTLLTAGQQFAGTYEDVTLYSAATVSVLSDEASDANGLVFEQSHDGINVHSVTDKTQSGNDPDAETTIAVTAKFFRVRYTNGVTNQGTFSLQTKFSISQTPILASDISQDIEEEQTSQLVRAVMTGIHDNNKTFQTVNIRPGGAMDVSIDEPTGAYGDISTVENTTLVQLKFPYILNTREITEQSISGSAAVANDVLTVSTAASANTSSSVFSNAIIRGVPGQALTIRFNAKFDDEAGGSEQLVGWGNVFDGLFFGFDRDEFGILRRSGGSPEIQTLTVTTKSTTAENITITLNGVADATVAVTDQTAGDVSNTAQEIADHDYSGIDNGYKAFADGDTVVFVSFDDENKVGSFSVSGTTVVGTFAETVAGAVATDVWIDQADWSTDNLDGDGDASNISGMDLNHQFFNLYQLKIGGGNASFFVMNPGTSKFVIVHEFPFVNSFSTVSVGNPNLPVYVSSKNTSNTTQLDVQVFMLWAALVGKDADLGPVFSSVLAPRVQSGVVEVPVITIRNKLVFGGRQSRLIVEPVRISLLSNMNGATTNVTYRIYLNGIPTTGTSYADVDTNSAVEFDIAATSFVPGELVEAFQLASSEVKDEDLGKVLSELGPGETMLVTAEISKTHVANEIGATITHKELN